MEKELTTISRRDEIKVDPEKSKTCHGWKEATVLVKSECEEI
jgi:hypothetical protein